MNVEQVRNIVRRRVAETSQADFARAANCSRAYICDILAGKRDPGPKVLRVLGLTLRRETKVVYQPTNGR